MVFRPLFHDSTSCALILPSIFLHGLINFSSVYFLVIPLILPRLIFCTKYWIPFSPEDLPLKFSSDRYRFFLLLCYSRPCPISVCNRWAQYSYMHLNLCSTWNTFWPHHDHPHICFSFFLCFAKIWFCNLANNLKPK